MPKRILIKTIAECCRVLLGGTLIFSGTVKAIDPMGTAIKTGEYLASFGMEYGKWFELLLSFNIIAVEFMLGVCMLTAVYRKLTTLGVLIFMSFMTPLTLYLAVFNPVPEPRSTCCSRFCMDVLQATDIVLYVSVVLVCRAFFVPLLSRFLLLELQSFADYRFSSV